MTPRQEGGELLRKVLLLEQRQDFANRAIVGGLSHFASELHKGAEAGSVLPEVTLVLTGYDQESNERRALSIRKALEMLDGTSSACEAIPTKVSRPDYSGEGNLRSNVTETVVAAVPREPSSSSEKTSSDSRGRSAIPPVPTRARTNRRQSPQSSPLPKLDMPLTAFKGIGAALAKALNHADIYTLRDLLYYFPREHLDFRRLDRIRSLRYGDRATIIGIVQSARVQRIRPRFSLTRALIADESGHIEVTWFNQPYLEEQLQRGRRIAISGEVSSFSDRLTFTPRDYEWFEDQDLTHGGRLVPVYPMHKGMHQKQFRSLMRRLSDSMSDQVEEYLPASVRQTLDLVDATTAVSQFHFPDGEDRLTQARRRLAFDEIFSIRVGLRLRKHALEQGSEAPELRLSADAHRQFLQALPFSPTNAQCRVLGELQRSLASHRPMSHLIQGDVGSGKTVLAAYALYAAAVNACQGVIMAPTEMLARQHSASLSTLLSQHGVSVELLVGSTKAQQRAEILAGVRSGTVNVVAGTQALFQEGVEFHQLGVAVVDEQHRFGVHQRSRLRDKGRTPHLLTMSATPIPRTLALTVYGDLDISVLDELPPGRKPIETRLVASDARAYRVIESEVAKGNQAFVVCPLIEESADADTRSAVAEHQRLQNNIFPQLRIGLLHGRLPPKDKDRILEAFREGAYHVLVATTVIEVGIDVPNATVMVIRDAHRFGLAQLHQLRGRVGRGGEHSYCVLVSEASNGPTYERLLAVVTSRDGFVLAEEDLRLRGPGEFWGTRQSGLPRLKVAGPGNVDVIELAQRGADLVLERDPTLSLPEHCDIRVHVDQFWSSSADIH